MPLKEYNFPKKSEEGDLYLHEIGFDDQIIVIEHLKISAQFEMWYEVNNYLQEQIKTKKTLPRLKNGKQFTDLVDKYLKYYLCCSKFFECYLTFRDVMEKLLVCELSTKNFNYTKIYFDNPSKPDVYKFDDYFINEWDLKDCKKMTVRDLAKMEEFRREFMALLNDCIKRMADCRAFLNLKSNKKFLKKCMDVRDRYGKWMDKVSC